MENLKLHFESSGTFKEAWLHVEFPVDNEPILLLDALFVAGWKENPRGLSARVSPCDGIQEIKVLPPQGSGLFNSLTAEEWTRAIENAEMVLTAFGWDTDKIPHYQLSRQDCI
jgi:hypothetical protein